MNIPSTPVETTAGQALRPHLVWALSVAVAAGVTFWLIPGLREDAPASFGTAGVFLTLYGLILAVLEARRARLAAEAARKAALQAARVVGALSEARMLNECKAAIDSALDALDHGDRVASSAISRILRVYHLHFAEQLLQDDSKEKFNESMLSAYQHRNARDTKSGHPRTRKALIDMANQINIIEAALLNNVAGEAAKGPHS